MRLFVAIELSDAVRRYLRVAQERLRAKCGGVRWTRPEQIHLTVKFLGDVADARVPDVTAAVGRAAAAGSGFSMDVAGMGCFPPAGAVRIVWAGLEEPSGALAQCVEGFEAAFEEIGFARERRAFSPHLTVGRVREDRSGGQIRAAVSAFKLESVPQEVSAVTLMSSVLAPQGPTYTPVMTARLGG